MIKRYGFQPVTNTSARVVSDHLVLLNLIWEILSLRRSAISVALQWVSRYQDQLPDLHPARIDGRHYQCPCTWPSEPYPNKTPGVSCQEKNVTNLGCYNAIAAALVGW